MNAYHASRFNARSQALLLALCAWIEGPAAAAELPATWTGASNGNWSDPTQWSSNPAFPNNSSDIFDASSGIRMPSPSR